MTKNMAMGDSVYGEKRIAVEEEGMMSIMPRKLVTDDVSCVGMEKIEYRVWNPFRSKLAAAILGGVDQIHMPPGSKVLYLGAASGTTVSHVSDVVGPVSILSPSLQVNLDTDSCNSGRTGLRCRIFSSFRA